MTDEVPKHVVLPAADVSKGLPEINPLTQAVSQHVRPEAPLPADVSTATSHYDLTLSDVFKQATREAESRNSPLTSADFARVYSRMVGERQHSARIKGSPQPAIEPLEALAETATGKVDAEGKPIMQSVKTAYGELLEKEKDMLSAPLRPQAQAEKAKPELDLKKIAELRRKILKQKALSIDDLNMLLLLQFEEQTRNANRPVIGRLLYEPPQMNRQYLHKFLQQYHYYPGHRPLAQIGNWLRGTDYQLPPDAELSNWLDAIMAPALVAKIGGEKDVTPDWVVRSRHGGISPEEEAFQSSKEMRMRGQDVTDAIRQLVRDFQRVDEEAKQAAKQDEAAKLAQQARETLERLVRSALQEVKQAKEEEKKSKEN